MHAVYFRPRTVHNEEVVDAVFSLGEIEMVSLVGLDMGDEPVFKPTTVVAKKVEDEAAKSVPPIAPESRDSRQPYTPNAHRTRRPA